MHPLYDDFSTPTFDGRHNLIKGGSWISTGNLALRAARYAFRRHFFQHAGFRYVVSHHREPNLVNPYETDALVAILYRVVYSILPYLVSLGRITSYNVCYTKLLRRS